MSTARDKCFRCGKEEHIDPAGSFQVNQCDTCDELVCGDCAEMDYSLEGDPGAYVCTQWVCLAPCEVAA